MLSSGQFCDVKMPTKFHVTIWWYHVVLSCDVIMRDDNTPFSFFLETSLSRVYVKLKLANLSFMLKGMQNISFAQKSLRYETLPLPAGTVIMLVEYEEVFITSFTPNPHRQANVCIIWTASDCLLK
jgi:hypothetical protein